MLLAAVLVCKGRRVMAFGDIPAQTPYTIKKGDRGYHAWAVQRALNTYAGAELTEDGAYGKVTQGWVKRWQMREGILGDGLFGPATSKLMAQRLTAASRSSEPEGLLRSVIEGESGNLIAAVNWSVPGGVDCGYTQRRVYDGDAEEARQRAFDSDYQVGLLANRLIERHSIYYGKVGAQTHEMAWRLAVLYHNYPSGSEMIAKVGFSGLSSYWRNAQTWVTNIGAKFTDGAPVTTPLEWCQHYSLGSVPHRDPGTMVKYVVTWS